MPRNLKHTSDYNLTADKHTFLKLIGILILVIVAFLGYAYIRNCQHNEREHAIFNHYYHQTATVPREYRGTYIRVEPDLFRHRNVTSDRYVISKHYLKAYGKTYNAHSVSTLTPEITRIHGFSKHPTYKISPRTARLKHAIFIDSFPCKHGGLNYHIWRPAVFSHLDRSSLTSLTKSQYNRLFSMDDTVLPLPTKIHQKYSDDNSGHIIKISNNY